MKFLGKNSIFSLNVKIIVNEDSIIGIASGTALTLKALPLPSPIDIQVNKYFKKREAMNKYDTLLDEIKKASTNNIQLNFKMPILHVLGLNQRLVDRQSQLSYHLGIESQEVLRRANIKIDAASESPLLPMVIKRQNNSLTNSDSKKKYLNF